MLNGDCLRKRRSSCSPTRDFVRCMLVFCLQVLGDSPPKVQYRRSAFPFPIEITQ